MNASQPNIAGPIDYYLTTGQDYMFVKQAAPGTDKGEPAVELGIDVSRRFQPIDGFGASFTDASAFIMNRKLDDKAKEDLMIKLFDPRDGIGLSFTRQPMGSSDYARDFYSFNDIPAGEEDFALARFSIDHDKEDVIPLIKQALKLNPDLKLMSSPWSPPAWMKTSGAMIGGTLRKDCYKTYAEYFVRYIKAYQEAGLEIYAVSPQNEPLYVPKNYPGCGMDAETQAEFINDYLGPAFRKNKFTTKILCYDHNWDVTDYADVVLSHPAAQYIDGVAWHWYAGDPAVQAQIAEKFPGKEVYYTEGSGGEWIAPFDNAFMSFMVKGIKSVNNYTRCLVFWNMALDEKNGPTVPNFGKSTCRGLVKISQGEVTYNLDYYALAHFSRFIRPGAERVFAESKGDIYTLACVNKDNTLAIVAANDGKKNQALRFTLGQQHCSLDLPKKSAATLVLRLE
jgi:glucosylceramidase